MEKEDIKEPLLQETAKKSILYSIWPLLGLTAGFCFGLNNFLITVGTQGNTGLRGMYPQGFGFLLAHVAYHIYQAYLNFTSP